MEATEISEFSDHMKEGREEGMKRVSLAISVLAVLVAMVTVMGHRTHTEAVLMQTRAADQWNEYQAKKIRQGQVSIAADLLSLQPSSNEAAVQQKLTDYKTHLKKWSDDLTQEQAEAEQLEREVNLSERRAARFDLAEALLEIAVVLSSITLLTQQKYYALLGICLGLGGAIIAVSGIVLR
jgi:phage terminase Nu1 subunit (DNA packaging protein)